MCLVTIAELVWEWHQEMPDHVIISGARPAASLSAPKVLRSESLAAEAAGGSDDEPDFGASFRTTPSSRLIDDDLFLGDDMVEALYDALGLNVPDDFREIFHAPVEVASDGSGASDADDPSGFQISSSESDAEVAAAPADMLQNELVIAFDGALVFTHPFYSFPVWIDSTDYKVHEQIGPLDAAGRVLGTCKPFGTSFDLR